MERKRTDTPTVGPSLTQPWAQVVTIGANHPIFGLSLTQPWAQLVSVEAKRIETRSWRTPFRGWLAIHAAKGFPWDAKRLSRQEPFRSALASHYFRVPADFPLGAIVAVARLIDCIPTDEVRPHLRAEENGYGRDQTIGYYLVPRREYAFGDYSVGRWAWLLADVRKVDPPIPCRGALGLWRLPDRTRLGDTAYAELVRRACAGERARA
jgi:hypothetical protein